LAAELQCAPALRFIDKSNIDSIAKYAANGTR